jgi:hypothetical protein
VRRTLNALNAGAEQSAAGAADRANAYVHRRQLISKVYRSTDDDQIAP